MCQKGRQASGLVPDADKTQHIAVVDRHSPIRDRFKLTPPTKGPEKQLATAQPVPIGQPKRNGSTCWLGQHADRPGIGGRAPMLCRAAQPLLCRFLHSHKLVQERLELATQIGARQAKGHRRLQEPDFRAAVIALPAEPQAKDT